MTNHLIPQKFILSGLRRPEIRDQDVARAAVLWRHLPCLFLASAGSWQSLAFFVFLDCNCIPVTLPPLSHDAFPVSLSVSPPFPEKTLVIGFRVHPVLVWPHFNLTNYTFHDLMSKYLTFLVSPQVDMNWWGELLPPTVGKRDPQQWDRRAVV